MTIAITGFTETGWEVALTIAILVLYGKKIPCERMFHNTPRMDASTYK